jgi:hypothetical protein
MSAVSTCRIWSDCAGCCNARLQEHATHAELQGLHEVQFRVPNPRVLEDGRKLFHPPSQPDVDPGSTEKSGITPIGCHRRPSRPKWQLEPRQLSEEFFTS